MIITVAAAVLAIIGIYIAACGKDWKNEVKADIKQIVSLAVVVAFIALIIVIIK